MNHSTPGPPVHHQLPEFTQTYIHRVGDAIHPSHPLSSPSPPAPNPSQHQSLFQWVNSSHEVAKVQFFANPWSPPVSSVHGIFPGKSIEVDFYFLLQGILLIQGSNLSLLTAALAGEFFTTSARWGQVALVVKESAYQCRRYKRSGFHPWVEKIPWSSLWQPTPVFLPGESHGLRSLVGYSPQGCKESDMTEVT